MIGEREKFTKTMNYGSLTGRSYDILGNDIEAFYDASNDLVFVLDKTLNQNKPNVLLVINPVGDKKWDEILSGQYGVDLETIRPKQDNKYQKLDIEYSGLNVYRKLIDAFVSGDLLDEHITQLNILRDSAIRHSAMVRLNMSNEVISRTNVTIVKTKESIVRLQERLKTLRNRLAEQKKEIGRVSTKQSASKILKTESMIDATNEKLKRAKKRLESAQKRLEIATIDAELASNVLNQPALEIVDNVKNEPLAILPKYEIQSVNPDSNEGGEMLLESDTDKDDTMDTEKKYLDNDDEVNGGEVKPLLDKDPEIINEDIAFKPITFDAPNLPVPESKEEKEEDVPKFDFDIQSFSEPEIKSDVELETDIEPTEDSATESEKIDAEPENRPVLESITPIAVEELDKIADTDTHNTDNTVDDDITDFDAPALDGGVEQITDENVTVEQNYVPKSPIVEKESNDEYKETSESEKYTESAKESYENNGGENIIRPVPPVVPQVSSDRDVKPIVNYETDTSKSKPSGVYYLLLLILIVLSVFTLWLYQKNMGNGKPLFGGGDTKNTAVVETINADKNIADTDVNDGFLDNGLGIGNNKEQVSDNQIEQSKEIVPVQPVRQEPSEPIIIGAVPAHVSTFSGVQSVAEEPKKVSPEDVIMSKPIYGVAEKNDEMFVYEEESENVNAVPVVEDVVETVYYEDMADDAGFYDTDFVEETAEPENTPKQETTVVETVVKPEPEHVVYDGDEIYDDGMFYEEGFDEEEAMYQDGYDGYEE